MGVLNADADEAAHFPTEQLLLWRLCRILEEPTTEQAGDLFAAVADVARRRQASFRGNRHLPDEKREAVQDDWVKS